MAAILQLKPQDNKDPNSTDVEYKPIQATINKKIVKESGWIGFTFIELDDDGQGGKICGLLPSTAKELKPTLDKCEQGTMVEVTLTDSGDYRNVVRIEPLDIGGVSVNSPQATQETIPQVNIVPAPKPLQKVPAPWESGVDYNDRKDSKICLNVAAAEAVKLYGHVVALSIHSGSDPITDDVAYISKKVDESYRLAVSLIEKLGSLSDPVEEDNDSGYESDIAE